MKIKNAVVIITGASSGIGRALALELSARGAKLVLAARSKEKLAQLASELPDAFPVPLDLRETGAAEHLVSTAKEKYGRVDALINNAGQGLRANLEDIDLAEYRAIMELNVFAVLRTLQTAIPIMRAQGGGMILNVSSMVSKSYIPGLAAYASTKYALNALSLTARAELAVDNIVVSVFHPKMTATDFGANALGESYDSSGGRPGMGVDTAEDVALRIAEQIESEEPEMRM